MDNLYLRLGENIRIHKQPFGGFMRLSGDEDERFSSSGVLTISPFVTQLLSECDGTKSYSQLLQDVRCRYPEKEGAVLATSQYMLRCLKEGVLFAYSKPKPGDISIGGSEQYFSPIHLSLELTERCNLHCAHCYRDCLPSPGIEMNYAKLMPLLDTFYANGVYAIELTGGEPLLHSHFKEILVKSSQLFDLVAILSNGILINDEIAAIIGNANNVVIQVDLDGDTTETHESIRGKHTFDRTIESIKTLHRHGAFFRCGMNLAASNYDAVENTAKLAFDLGANIFILSPIMSLGRGQGMELLSAEQMSSLPDLIEKLQQEYPRGFIATGEEIQMSVFDIKENCGAGTKSMAVSPSGTLRPCALMPEDMYTFSGNVFRDKYVDILKAAPTSFIAGVQSPTAPTCRDCESFSFCVGCFVRPLVAQSTRLKEEDNFTCSWERTTKFSETLGVSINK